MHARAVEPDEERLACLLLAIDEIERTGKELLVHRFHAFPCQRARVFDLAIGIRMDHTARTKTLLEGRILRIVRILWLFFCIKVVKIAKELIESMLGRKEFIFVAEMIFSELSGRVTQGFK